MKVQFSDGGYKRFQRNQFNDVVLGNDNSQRLNFGSQAYEWYYENYAPDREETSGTSSKSLTRTVR